MRHGGSGVLLLQLTGGCTVPKSARYWWFVARELWVFPYFIKSCWNLNSSSHSAWNSFSKYLISGHLETDDSIKCDDSCLVAAEVLNRACCFQFIQISLPLLVSFARFVSLICNNKLKRLWNFKIGLLQPLPALSCVTQGTSQRSKTWKANNMLSHMLHTL